MAKRGRRVDDAREEEEWLEPYAALLRQCTSRAIDRLRLHRHQSSAAATTAPDGRPMRLPGGAATSTPTTTTPMDQLVVQYCMYYLDTSSFPAVHYVRLAQTTLTGCADRVLHPRSFLRASSLPVLCEGLVAENTADTMQSTLVEVAEFLTLRESLGELLNERIVDGDEGVDDDDDDNDGFGDDVGDDEEAPRRHGRRGGEDSWEEMRGGGGTLLDRAAIIYRSLEFWLRVDQFLHALSRGSANMDAYHLRPRYERELMSLLHGLSSTVTSSDRAIPASSSKTVAEEDAQRPRMLSGENHVQQEKTPKTEVVKSEMEDPTMPVPSSSIVYEREGVAGNEGRQGEDGEEEEVALMTEEGQHKRELATAVLADALALSSCHVSQSLTDPSNGSHNKMATPSILVSEAAQEQLKGISAPYYAMVHARLGVMVARDHLLRLQSTAEVRPPPLTVQQRNLLEQEQQRQQERNNAAGEALALSYDTGVPADYVPDDRYYEALAQRQGEELGDEEEVYKDEVVDYYLKASAARRAAAASSTSLADAGSPANRRPRTQATSADGSVPLMKPHRFCKVKTGFTWTQYNRTHYDSRTNPPPRTVLWYEFTLFYPALAKTKKDMRNIFRIEDTPRGPEDDFCLLVFSVGPPYADVAYRIVRKQWDTRRGGVRISFDANGRYKIFFRFTNSNYRR